MVWGAISWHGLRPLVVLRKKVTGEHYRSILAGHLDLMLQTVYPGERPLFQEENVPVHTTRWVQTWLDEYKDEMEHLTWYPQFPDLNIIKPL